MNMKLMQMLFALNETGLTLAVISLYGSNCLGVNLPENGLPASKSCPLPLPLLEGSTSRHVLQCWLDLLKGLILNQQIMTPFYVNMLFLYNMSIYINDPLQAFILGIVLITFVILFNRHLKT